MSNFPSALKRLRNQKGLTQAQLAAALGVGKSTISMYEVGAREPDFEGLESISDYFNVPLTELIQDVDRSAATAKDERDIARDLESMMREMSNGGDLMFDGNPMTEEAKESIMAAMRLGLEAAKAKNKARFTPKKYRKE